MTRRIVISTSGFEAEAELLEDRSPKTCEAIWEELPFRGKARVYKEELYFEIPVGIEPRVLTPEVERGDISYWPKGPAFCVFYGDSQPVSSVSTFARLKEGWDEFQDVSNGDEIVVRRAE